MNLVLSSRADKQKKKLSKEISKKFYKQLAFLMDNPLHPSLRARKMGGTGVYECRIDDHYRFAYEFSGDTVKIIAVGPHDEGLGKK